MSRYGIVLTLPVLFVAGLTAWAAVQDGPAGQAASPVPPVPEKPLAAGQDDGRAVLAGGCFWCVEVALEPLEGVLSVTSGYAGGDPATANYDAVSNGRTNHAEVVLIEYDPEQITYDELLRVHFATHDPTTKDRQGPDVGRQYRSAIFYDGDAEREVAEAYIQQMTAAGTFADPIVTTLEPLTEFHPAEAYHQDFVERNPAHPYVVRWALPKVEKVKKTFPDLLTARAPSTQPAE
jgi:peptide-methionine (S)-S-oxide reductase